MKIINCGKYYTVINTNGDYANHAHIKTKNTAELLCKLIRNKTLPNSSYLIDSAIRITLDEKYRHELEIKQKRIKDKQNYYNPQKGVRR